MQKTTVSSFASELKMPVDVLLEQLNAASVKKTSGDDELTEADKTALLASLRQAHGVTDTAKKKITLTRKSTTEIRQADGTGKTRTVHVEVKKKRTFVARDTVEVAAAPEVKALDVAETVPRLELPRTEPAP